MKVQEIMSTQVVRIGADEPVEVAARTLAHYNVGILPVCGADGRVCGLVTDRDLVTRCMALGRAAGEVKVRQVMTGRVIAAAPDMDAEVAAGIMGREQVRRLPVLDHGRLCGVVTLGDLAVDRQTRSDAADALAEITQNICRK